MYAWIIDMGIWRTVWAIDLSILFHSIEQIQCVLDRIRGATARPSCYHCRITSTIGYDFVAALRVHLLHVFEDIGSSNSCVWFLASCTKGQHHTEMETILWMEWNFVSMIVYPVMYENHTYMRKSRDWHPDYPLTGRLPFFSKLYLLVRSYLSPQI